MTRQQTSDVIKSSEVAALFRVSPRTIDRWIHEGKLFPAFRTPGGQARFRMSDVLELMGDNGQESNITDGYHND